MTLKELGDHSAIELGVMATTIQRYKAFETARSLHSRAEAGEKLDAREKLLIEEHYYQELDRLGI